MLKELFLLEKLTLDEIQKITKDNPNLEFEAFMHGAMCISYSGRCLLSNYLTNRDSNHGECVQACRWKYSLLEETRPGEQFDLTEDTNGTYIFNSKDLCLIEHIDKAFSAGITSFKIEGRMKSPYYVATVINAYRRAIDDMYKCLENGKKFILNPNLREELNKASHRKYTTGFMIKTNEVTQNYETSIQEQDSKFMAIVRDVKPGKILVEQRNKFATNDDLEVLSPTDTFGKILKVNKMQDENGNNIEEAKNVQQLIWIETDLNIQVGDILRK